MPTDEEKEMCLLGTFLFTFCHGLWWWLCALSRAEVIAKEGCCCLFTAGRVSCCLFTWPKFSSIKILKIFTGWSPWEKLAPRRQVLLCPNCQVAMQYYAECCPDWATQGTNPSSAWGTSSLETGSGRFSFPALQDTAQKEFQGSTLGFWHLIDI